MSKPTGFYKSAIWVVAAAAWSLPGIAHAQAITAIAAGTDYLQTSTLSNAEIIGAPFPLVGVPESTTLGNSDTIIKRLTDATFAKDSKGALTATVDVQMLEISMQGTNGHCTVHISLTGSSPSKGTMKFTETSDTGGTFTSDVTVNYTAFFTPAASCPPYFTDHFTLKDRHGTWQTTPVSGEFLSVGAYGDVTANQHTGLPAGFADFYIVGTVEQEDPTAKHFVCEAFSVAGQPCP